MKNKTHRLVSTLLALCLSAVFTTGAFAAEQEPGEGFIERERVVAGVVNGKAQTALAENHEGSHIWNEGVVVTEATCCTEGEMVYTCTVDGCEATKTEKIDVTDEHEWNIEVVAEPTCSTKGIRSYVCPNCDAKKSEEIEMLPHNFDKSGSCIKCNALKELPFTDVPDNWARRAITYVYYNDLMKGYTGATFAPNDNMTRAMVVTVLHRMAGSPEPSAANPFSDVSAGKWYTAAIVWAAENGIVNGYGNDTFKPEQKVIRQELVAMVYRYAVKFDGADAVDNVNLSRFSDGSKISAWAADSVKWSVGNGIIKGYPDGTFRPADTATRAEWAQILYNYLEK